MKEIAGREQRAESIVTVRRQILHMINME